MRATDVSVRGIWFRVFAFALFLTACGGGGGEGSPVSSVAPLAAAKDPVFVTVDPSGKFAYVANDESNNVSAFTINAVTGTLTAVAGSPFAAGTVPFAVTVDPSGKFPYVANFIDGNVSAFTIDAVSGTLTAVAGSPFASVTLPRSVTVDPLGRFAYVANEGVSNGVSAFTIDAV